MMSRRSQFQIFPDVVEEASPSLVHIEVTYGGDGGESFSGLGSGFIVESDGIILTNAHVIDKQMANIMVTLQDGRVLQGTVLHIDVGADLATIGISASDLPTMKLGVGSNSRPGEWVIAMGSPHGLSNTITTGVVSHISRNSAELAKFGLRGSTIPEFIQTDASITLGNSGGPLINLDGEVIGINTLGMKNIPGISFAIPIDYAKDFLVRSKKYHINWACLMESCLRKVSLSQNDPNLPRTFMPQVDPYIVSIEAHCGQVALYKFCEVKVDWEKTEVEGTLLLYQREADPQYGFTIINHLSLDDPVELITKDLYFQLQSPFLFYKNNASEIFGIRFQDKVCLVSRISHQDQKY